MPYSDRRIHAAKAWTGVNLSDTFDIVLADPTARYTEDGGTLTDESAEQYPRVFHSNVAGWVNIMAEGDTIDRPFYLCAGQTYSYGVRRFMLTGASGIGDGQIQVGR